MVVHNRETADKAMKTYAKLRKPMVQWLQGMAGNDFASIIEMRRMFPTADAIKGSSFTCFNIGGNHFRLITTVSYEGRFVIIEEILTHAEYSKKYMR